MRRRAKNAGNMELQESLGQVSIVALEDCLMSRLLGKRRAIGRASISRHPLMPGEQDGSETTILLPVCGSVAFRRLLFKTNQTSQSKSDLGWRIEVQLSYDTKMESHFDGNSRLETLTIMVKPLTTPVKNNEAKGAVKACQKMGRLLSFSSGRAPASDYYIAMEDKALILELCVIVM